MTPLAEHVAASTVTWVASDEVAALWVAFGVVAVFALLWTLADFEEREP